jgi:hypothetical protein
LNKRTSTPVLPLVLPRPSVVSALALGVVCAGPPLGIAFALHEKGGSWRMSDVLGVFVVVFAEEVLAAALAWVARIYAERKRSAGAVRIAQLSLRLALAAVVVSAIGGFFAFLLTIAIGFG